MVRSAKMHPVSSRDGLKDLASGGFARNVQIYQGEDDLRERLRALERVHAGTAATVVLLLHKDFGGHLPSIIRRSNPGNWLIITSDLGTLPGLVGGRDIAFRAGMLGWNRLSFIHDLQDVVQQLRSESQEEGMVEVLIPAE